MKRLFAITVLVLVMAASIFAAERTPYDNLPDAQSTKVVLDLDKNPSYVMAVTAKADRATEASTVLSHVDEIALGYDSTDETRPVIYTVDGTYYVSYRFLETEAVKLKIQLSGDMVIKGKTDTTAADDERIPYSVTIAKDDDAIASSVNAEPETLTVDSKDKTKHDIATLEEVNKLGIVSFDNFKFNVTSYTGADGVVQNTLKGKKIGYYTSTVTLTVEAHS